MLWADRTADALDAQMALTRVTDIVAVVDLTEPPPAGPDAGTVTTVAPTSEPRWPEPAGQLRSLAGMLTGVAVTAVLLTVAARLLRRRHA
jgi:hypothetical protein